MSERSKEEIIDDITAMFRDQINSTPELMSLLWDVGLMPEQIDSPINAARMGLICELHKRGSEPKDSK